MKLKQSWILLVVILASLTSYSQYPITKRIGKDSVIIMTVPQGEHINKLYGQYNSTIDSLKNVDSLKASYLKLAATRYDSLTSVYSQTTKLYKKQETDSIKVLNKEDLRDKIFGYTLLVTLMVFVNDIMNQ